jgi:hypothetical protein
MRCLDLTSFTKRIPLKFSTTRLSVVRLNLSGAVSTRPCLHCKQDEGAETHAWKFMLRKCNPQLCSKGFCRWCITLAIGEIMDFVHRPVFWKHTGSVTVLRWGEEDTLLCSSQIANQSHLTLIWERTTENVKKKKKKQLWSPQCVYTQQIVTPKTSRNHPLNCVATKSHQHYSGKLPISEQWVILALYFEGKYL